MMMRGSFRRAAKTLGIILTLVALAFVLREIIRSDMSDWRLLRSAGGVATLLGIGSFYGASLATIYWAWLALLGAESRKVATHRLVAMYGRFQIYKYVPSNVVHQVSRYAFLQDAGVRHRSIIWSTLAETALIIVVAFGISALFGGLGLAEQLGSQLSRLPDGVPAMIGAGGGVALLVLLGVALFLRDRLAPVVDFLRNRIAGASIASALYGFFFVATGVLLYWMLWQTVAPGTALPPIGIVIAANALAWVLGTVTPGAPGGVGVREFVLIASLAPFGIESAAVALAAQYRLATVIGDLCFYGGAQAAALGLRRRAS